MGLRDTSLQAYRQIQPIIGEKQRQVLTVFTEHASIDYTNMELAEILGWSINRVTPRVLELRNMGYLTLSTRRQCNVTRNSAYAWRLKESPQTCLTWNPDGSVVLKRWVERDEWERVDRQLRRRGYKHDGDGVWQKR